MLLRRARALARSSAVRLSRRLPGFEEEIAARFIARRSRECGIRLALYDPLTDTLRLPDAFEGMSLLSRGVIADAVPWMRKLEGRLPHGGLVLDVGGFRGITAQWFARQAGRVIVFEPLPENAASIRQMLHVRGLTNVTVQELAVSDRSGSAELFAYEGKGHNSLGRVNTSRYTHSLQVRTTTLDEFAKANAIDRVDVLKVDVEGFEAEVLRGAAELLATGRVATVLFESNPPVLASIGRTASAIHEILASHGYVVTDLDGRRVEAADLDRASEMDDFLAVPQASYDA
jgi:FkbM family methyltransferase